MSKRKIILFELNEVPWRVMKDYCEKHPDTFLAKNIKKCFKYETVTPDQGHLSPWITWPTLHRGVDGTKHHIHDFNQDMTDANKNYPSVWEILQKKGISTGVCGSMHSSPPPKNFREYSFFIPDPFAATKDAHPEYIEPFQDFNLQMSRESARNVSGGLNMKAGTKVIMTAPKLGLRPSTFVELGMHVINERRKPWVKTRRRTYQMVLAFDVFMKQLKNTKPEFSTFFTNHVASSMHRYWAATYPQDYDNFNIEKDWVETYKNEIYFTMGIFSRFFKEVAEFVDNNPEYVLVIASSMGQASTTAEQIDSQVYIEKSDVFMNKMGLQAGDYQNVPCMFPQYNVNINPDKVEGFRNELRKLVIDKLPVEFRETDNGFFSIDFGQKNCSDAMAEFAGKPVAFKELGIHNLIIEDKADSTAYHIPEGTCLVYDSTRDANTNAIEKISSTALVPNILKNFGIEIPAYMNYVPMQGLSA
ncbi:MAG TPA: hypothetical protein PKN75_00910 [Bacteroidia bacterium]|nr:hypothetical protein [Bacteroidia bacterium]HNU32132.1 hypothetical protein [Bacteroidia bacterium]